MGEAIQHPNVFYTRYNGIVNWLNSAIPTLWNNVSGGGSLESTTSVKTVYDPSPRGFKVPIPRAFAVLVNGSEVTGNGGGSLNGDASLDELHNKYRVFPEKDRKGTPFPMTATGQRADRAGLEAYLPGDNKGELGGLWSMFGVYYWTCIQNADDEAYTLVIRKDYPQGYEVYSYGFKGSKTMARPVRCILDK